ncbi:MAG: hypothetical protein EBS64_02870, partial [Verrucomicrobia bacterium]|nr:hypothetical protein [Verrucomicrobiota bacterium]
MFKGRHKIYIPHLKGSRGLLALAIFFGLLYGASCALGIPFLVGKVLPLAFGTAAERAAPLLTFPLWTGWWPLFLPKGYEVLFAVAFLPFVFVVRGIAQFFASFLINLAGLRVVESVRLA